MTDADEPADHGAQPDDQGAQSTDQGAQHDDQTAANTDFRDRFDPNRAVERLSALTVTNPALVVVVFLLATVVFAGGVGLVEQEAGTDQFTEEVPAMEAMEEIEDEFDEPGDEADTAAQLFIIDDNVLSRPALLRTLETQERLESHETLRIETTTSHADLIATELDDTAETPADRRRAVEQSTDSELTGAISAVDERDGFEGQLSTDYNPRSQRASTAQAVVQYDVPDETSTDRLETLQYRSLGVIEQVPGNEPEATVYLFGEGILQSEVAALLSDTAIVVFPAALGFILLFLLVAYRDPIDLGIGLSALVLTLVWTFGFMGYAGIPFSDAIVSVFPLLLAVGIDFGIHSINRYREVRIGGADIEEAMQLTTNQLGIAFLIVTVTTVFSFAANIVSPLGSLQDFGTVAAVGMVFTFLIFGVYLPAAKVGTDRLRQRLPIPAFGQSPIVREGSRFSRSLGVGVGIAKTAPVVFVLAVVLLGGVAGAYGTGVDTEFSEEAFFPDEEWIDRYDRLPEPFSTSTYTFIDTLDILEDDFEESFAGAVTIYIDQPVRRADSLERIDRLGRNPPDSFEQSAPGRADTESILTVIEREQATDDEFDQLVRQRDRLGTGVPDRDIGVVYDELETARPDESGQYLAGDRESARVDIMVDPDAETATVVSDTQQLADRSPLSAVATGDQIVQQSVIDATLDSALRSLIVAFVLTAVFLLVSYWLLEGRAVYGLLNLLPVVVTVGLLLASMRALAIPLTPINAPILAIAIGLGVDYTVHFVHRFVDEFETGGDTFEALAATIAGTGGALTASMLTTVFGIGMLATALIPLIREFGILLVLGVFYAYLASIVLVPPAIVAGQRGAAFWRTHRNKIAG